MVVGPGRSPQVVENPQRADGLQGTGRGDLPISTLQEWSEPKKIAEVPVREGLATALLPRWGLLVLRVLGCP